VHIVDAEGFASTAHDLGECLANHNISGYLSKPRYEAGKDLSLRASQRGGAALLAPAHIAALPYSEF
jgi:hypothetical protein